MPALAWRASRQGKLRSPGFGSQNRSRFAYHRCDLSVPHRDAVKPMVRPARLGRPGVAAVGGAQDSSDFAYDKSVIRVDERDGMKRNRRAAGLARPGLAAVGGV